MDCEIKISNILEESCIDLDLKSSTKKEALKELIHLLYENGKLSDEKRFLEDVYLREEEGVTGVGEGIAIPHGKSDFVIKTSIAIGRAAHDIEWETLDDKPVRCIILFAVKNKEAANHITLLSGVARAICREEVVQALFSMEDKKKIIELF